MDDKTAKKWLSVIRRYADQLPDGYLKREFYEDIVQDTFCRCLDAFSRLKNKFPPYVILHTYAKSCVLSRWNNLQKIYKNEHLCAAVPRGIGMRAEWAKIAATPGNYLAEMWFDLQKYASDNLTDDEKEMLYRMYKGLPLVIAALGKKKSRAATNKLYLKLRREFVRRERPFRGVCDPCGRSMDIARKIIFSL